MDGISSVWIWKICADRTYENKIMREDINRELLHLWTSLLESVKNFERDKGISHHEIEPWNCDSQEISAIWIEIISPKYLNTLEAALAGGNPKLPELNIKWMLEALKEGRQRRNEVRTKGELDHQMLVLWMSLSGAVKKYATDHKTPYLSIEPWNCDSPDVKSVWAEITDPRHLAYLEESLASLQNMIIDPPHLATHDLQVKQTRAALEECKKRQN